MRRARNTKDIRQKVIRLFDSCASFPLPGRITKLIAPHFPDFDLTSLRIHEHLPWYVNRFAVIKPSAFTLGKNLYFAPGHYDIHSAKGIALLAHEITHSRQYRQEGNWTFAVKYLKYFLQNRRLGLTSEEAYLEIPFEILAREKEREVLLDLTGLGESNFEETNLIM